MFTVETFKSCLIGLFHYHIQYFGVVFIYFSALYMAKNYFGGVFSIASDYTGRMLQIWYIYLWIPYMGSFYNERTNIILSNCEALKWLTYLGFCTPSYHRPRIRFFVKRESSRYFWSPGFFILFFHHTVATLTRAFPSIYNLTWPICSYYPASTGDLQQDILSYASVYILLLLYYYPKYTLWNYLSHFYCYLILIIPILLGVHHASLTEYMVTLGELILLSLGYPGLNDLLLPRVKRERYTYLIAQGFPDMFNKPLQNDFSINDTANNGTETITLITEMVRRSQQALYESPLFLNEITGKIPSTRHFIDFLWRRFKDIRYISFLMIMSSKFYSYSVRYPVCFLGHFVASCVSLNLLYKLFYRTNELAFFWRLLNDFRATLVNHLSLYFSGDA